MILEITLDSLSAGSSGSDSVGRRARENVDDSGTWRRGKDHPARTTSG